MHADKKLLILLTLAAAGCAAGGGSLKVYQADYRPPIRADVSEDVEWSMMVDAKIHIDRADNARDSGNLDQYRQECKIAADQFSAFADKFPSSEWRIVARRIAATRYRDAQELPSAAAQAQKMYDDPGATEVTKALGSRLLAAIWQQQAAVEMKEGKIERIKLLVAQQRAGQPLKPHPPAGAWKRYVEAADNYAKYVKADPTVKPSGETVGGASPPWQIAVTAAQVEYASDNVEDARRRLAAIIETWPGDGEAMDTAVPYYLETFLLKSDDEGYEAELTRLQPMVKAQGEKAASAAKAPDATEEKKKSAEAFARLSESLAKLKEGTGFSVAARLFQAGKNAEAGTAFEKFADENKQNTDAPAALYNAAIAWDKTKDGKRAEALREKLLRTYPDAKVAPQATLAQAAALSRRGDHAGSLKLYGHYLEKWPEAEQRCIALQNVGVEVNQAGNKLEAARRFRTFGSDGKCAKDDPNAAANYLFYAAEFYRTARKKADEKETLRILSEVPGVTDTVAKSAQDEGKRRLKGLK